MPSESLPSPRAITQYIREEITTLLQANDIYELDSYGWLDAYNDIVDPELIGHPMRQRDSFWWRFLLATDSPNPPQLIPWEKALVIADGDFEGLMEAARLSIGLMLFQRDKVGERLDTFDTSISLPMISVHLISAMSFLSSASGRLRDFFISAVFKKITERPTRRRGGMFPTGTEFYEKNSERKKYAAPFKEATDKFKGHVDSSIANAATQLTALADEIENFRLMRHSIIHVIATDLASNRKKLVDNPPSAVGDDNDFQIDWEATHKMVEKEEFEYQERLAQPLHWYKKLIEASNHVFIVERALRSPAFS
jgi:hypothetical protein